MDDRLIEKATTKISYLTTWIIHLDSYQQLQIVFVNWQKPNSPGLSLSFGVYISCGSVIVVKNEMEGKTMIRYWSDLSFKTKMSLLVLVMLSFIAITGFSYDWLVGEVRNMGVNQATKTMMQG